MARKDCEALAERKGEGNWARGHHDDPQYDI